MLWAPVNPGRDIPWTKIPDFGWIYKQFAASYLSLTKTEAVAHIAVPGLLLAEYRIDAFVSGLVHSIQPLQLCDTLDHHGIGVGQGLPDQNIAFWLGLQVFRRQLPVSHRR